MEHINGPTENSRPTKTIHMHSNDNDDDNNDANNNNDVGRLEIMTFCGNERIKRNNM